MICHLCKAPLPEGITCYELFEQLAYYTLSHPNPTFFIHQYIIDAYGASHLTKQSKPIAPAFTLIGLYLAIERGYTGKEVQLAHMELGKTKREYPVFEIPQGKAVITVRDVAEVLNETAEKYVSQNPVEKMEAVKLRDEKIMEWAKAVWELWGSERTKVINLLGEINFNYNHEQR